jgi:hypothetical protein
MTTMTPPAGAGLPAAPPPASPPSSSSRVIAILAIVFGSLVILGTAGSAVFSTAASAAVRTGSSTADAAGIDRLEADLSAGSLRIAFADVTEAELTVTGTGGADRWILRRDGDTLTVESRDPFWGGGWFWGGGAGEAELLLPRDTAGIDADLAVAAGAIEVDGEFGELVLELGAGRADVRGSADETDIDIAAGRADVDLDDVRQADLAVSAGSLRVTLTGDQPDDISAEVSAGLLTLVVPEGDYDISSEVSGGSFEDRVSSTSGASSTISVEVSAGQAVLRSAR